jgi:hypothetical protein
MRFFTRSDRPPQDGLRWLPARCIRGPRRSLRGQSARRPGTPSCRRCHASRSALARPVAGLASLEVVGIASQRNVRSLLPLREFEGAGADGLDIVEIAQRSHSASTSTSVGSSLVNTLGEGSGFVSIANAETPAQKCAKRKLVLINGSCRPAPRIAETPAQKCAKRKLVLINGSCRPAPRIAETPAEKCAKRKLVLINGDCRPAPRIAETPAEKCAKKKLVLVNGDCRPAQ